MKVQVSISRYQDKIVGYRRLVERSSCDFEVNGRRKNKEKKKTSETKKF